MSKLFIDIGSTYFKVACEGEIVQYFRDFNRNIFDDLGGKCEHLLKQYNAEKIYQLSEKLANTVVKDKKTKDNLIMKSKLDIKKLKKQKFCILSDLDKDYFTKNKI